jgi:hypothetical protein
VGVEKGKKIAINKFAVIRRKKRIQIEDASNRSVFWKRRLMLNNKNGNH